MSRECGPEAVGCDASNVAHCRGGDAPRLGLFERLQYMRIHPLTEEGMVVSKAKLAALRAADEVRKEIAQSKNELESYILKVRGGLWCRSVWRCVNRVCRARGYQINPRVFLFFFFCSLGVCSSPDAYT